MNGFLWFIACVLIGFSGYFLGYWNYCLKLIKTLDSVLEYKHSLKDKQYREGWFECLSYVIDQFRWKV